MQHDRHEAIYFLEFFNFKSTKYLKRSMILIYHSSYYSNPIKISYWCISFFFTRKAVQNLVFIVEYLISFTWNKEDKSKSIGYQDAKFEKKLYFNLLVIQVFFLNKARSYALYITFPNLWLILHELKAIFSYKNSGSLNTFKRKQCASVCL